MMSSETLELFAFESLVIPNAIKVEPAAQPSIIAHPAGIVVIPPDTTFIVPVVIVELTIIPTPKTISVTPIAMFVR